MNEKKIVVERTINQRLSWKVVNDTGIIITTSNDDKIRKTILSSHENKSFWHVDIQNLYFIILIQNC